MSQNLEKELGPLASLVGTWEGMKGIDRAPSDEPKTLLQEKTSKYRERLQFEPTGRVDNHSQILYGLRYSTAAWRLDQPDPFHEELGYWLWDAENEQVMRCFMVPRGVTVIAGGTVQADATEFKLQAESGSNTYGICSNQFLDKEFKTVRYDLKINIHDHESFSYHEDTQLLIKNKKDIFHHTDENTLNKVSK